MVLIKYHSITVLCQSLLPPPPHIAPCPPPLFLACLVMSGSIRLTCLLSLASLLQVDRLQTKHKVRNRSRKNRNDGPPFPWLLFPWIWHPWLSQYSQSLTATLLSFSSTHHLYSLLTHCSAPRLQSLLCDNWGEFGISINHAMKQFKHGTHSPSAPDSVPNVALGDDPSLLLLSHTPLLILSLPLLFCLLLDLSLLLPLSSFSTSSLSSTKLLSDARACAGSVLVMYSEPNWFDQRMQQLGEFRKYYYVQWLPNHINSPDDAAWSVEGKPPCIQ